MVRLSASGNQVREAKE